MSEHWLTIVIVILIIAIVVDGLRRMRNARRDSLKMALRPVTRSDDDDNSYGSEFPSGGARPSNKKIDPSRIQQARSKYDFGKDMHAWKNKVADKIAEHTGIKEENEKLPESARIEPSVEELDPLLDELPEGRHKVAPWSQKQDSEQAKLEESVADDRRDKEIELDSDTDIDIDTEESEVITADTDTIGSDDEVAETIPEPIPKREPVQVSLNLDDAVPMLMDSLDDADVIEDTRVDTKTAAKKEADPIVSVGARVKSSEQPHTTHSANKPRYESKYVDHKQQATNTPQEVLVIHVRAPENEYFYGDDLLELILDNGLRFGAMNIFHHHADEDGEGPILFSMANMVKPGTFDLHSFEELSTVGISFFVTLPAETGKNMDAFDQMLTAATRIAERLNGELQDENRSVLTKQTIEHYRERVRDFSRRQQLEKNKH